MLTSHQITASELIHSTNLQNLYFSKDASSHSPIFRVIFHNGENKSCSEAASDLRNRINGAVDAEMMLLAKTMTAGNKKKYEDSLAAAHDYYIGISKGAAEILTQNILINATRNAARDAFAFHSADADLMNFTNTVSMQKMHIAEANSFWMSSYRLPYYMTVFWMLTVCVFPLVFLLSLLPLMQNVYKVYLNSQIYIWSWPPLFNIIHFFVSLSSAASTSLFNTKTGGVSFSNINTLTNLHSNFAYTAGALAASVPVVSYFITKGIASILSNAAQHFGGMAQSLSTAEAQSIAQGNVSMASYSGWNMNYDNVNAHKFDTNHSHADGKLTAQHDNGALISRMPDGSTVSSVQPALSSAALSLHGAERVAASLQESAQQSFHNAETYRVASDSHLQQALTGLKQFSDTSGHDVRDGVGVNKNVTNAINEDIRMMQDAVQQYNDHQDTSNFISVEGALRGQINTSHAFVGKAAKWLMGASADLSVTGRLGEGKHHSAQDFFNSSEGQSFAKAFNHMESMAKSQHLDVADNQSLSQSEQIAANLSQGHALAKQASIEFNEGLNYQKSANFTKENAHSIDSNLDQSFHNWVVEHYGAEGQSTLLKTDGASINRQEQWAESFFISEGKSLIQSQVEEQLTNTKHKTHSHYQQQSQNLESSTKEKILSQHSLEKEKIVTATQNFGTVGLSTDVKQDAALIASTKETPLMNDFNNQNKQVLEQINKQNAFLRKQHINKKGDRS